jgi:hypothetical protein
MLIYNAKKNDANDWDFDLKLTEEEVDYLVNMSVSTLLTMGTISLVEQDSEQHIDLTAGDAVVN